jgi:hypothetical protein
MFFDREKEFDLGATLKMPPAKRDGSLENGRHTLHMNEEMIAPRTFTLIEECHRELEVITKKLAPVMMSPRAEKMGADTPDVTALEARLGSLVAHVRDLSSRIKI